MLTNFCCFLFILYIISLFSLYRLYIINHFHVIGKKDFEMIYYHFIFSFTAIILKMIFLVRRLKNLKNNFYDQPEIFTELMRLLFSLNNSDKLINSDNSGVSEI